MSENWSEIFPAGFNAAEQPPVEEFHPLPAGWYQVLIVSAEVVDTRAGGKRLAIRYDVAGGDFNGRVLWGSINIRNANQKAQEIGLRELGALARACGFAYVRDSLEFCGKVLEVRVAIRADVGYNPRNEIKGYRPVASQAVPRPTLPQYVTAPSAPPAPATTVPSVHPAPARTPAPPEAVESPLPWQV